MKKNTLNKLYFLILNFILIKYYNDNNNRNLAMLTINNFVCIYLISVNMSIVLYIVVINLMILIYIIFHPISVHFI